MRKKVGLVTVTYNSEEVLPGFIDSLAKQSYADYVLCVIDNVSSDATVQLVEAASVPFHLIRNPTNVGVAAANNQGIEWCLNQGCEYVLLINNDTEFEEQLIEKLVDASEQSAASIVVPKMNYFFNKNHIWYGGGKFLPWQANMPVHTYMDTIDAGQLKGIVPIEYAPTCCALIRKAVFQDVGLMEPKYFVYFDDTDFFYRVKADGRHKAYMRSDIDFYHKVGSLTKSRTTGQKVYFSAFRNYYFLRNFIFYIRRQSRMTSWLYLPVFYVKIIINWILDRKYRRNLNTLSNIHMAIIQGFRM